MINKVLLRYGLRDPLAAIAYFSGGKRELLHICLKRTLTIEESEIERFETDLLKNKDFLDHISSGLTKVGRYIGEINMLAAQGLYVIIRKIKPKFVLETGVAAGVSSAFILRALEDNSMGELHSIDMPNYELELAKKIHYPAGAILPDGFEPGFVIPDSLKNRWRLNIGLSKEVMPSLLDELKSIEMFLHDGEHTYENMIFEYRLIWKHLKTGGVLLSDNIIDSSAFLDFSKEVKERPYRWYFTGIGAIRKSR